MKKDPKSMAMLILGKSKKKDEPEEETESEEGSDGEELGRALLDAIEEDDAQGVCDAIREIVDSKDY